MISHTFKCIFIHIPRCGGTSVEQWIASDDWWAIEPSTKHLLASQSKDLYREYWNEYFKFSFVRNPYTRLLSSRLFDEHFGLKLDQDGEIDCRGAEAMFGHPVMVEHDHRFHQRADIARLDHLPKQVYGNILDEPLDFIGKYETLKDDIAFLGKELGISSPFKHHSQKSTLPTRESELGLKTQNWVLDQYMMDFERYGYSRCYDDRFNPSITA